MDQAPVVRVADRLSELADETQPHRQVERSAVARHVVVQPNSVPVLVDDERRAHLVVEEVPWDEQARMLDPLGRQVLALRGMPNGLPRLGVGLALVEVDADAAVLAGKVLPGGVVVLPGRAGVVGTGLNLPRADCDALAGAVDPDAL